MDWIQVVQEGAHILEENTETNTWVVNGVADTECWRRQKGEDDVIGS